MVVWCNTGLPDTHCISSVHLADRVCSSDVPVISMPQFGWSVVVRR